MFTIAAFEFRQRVSRLSTWIYFLIFFILAGLWMMAAGGWFKDASVSFGSGKVFINSPFAVAQTIAILGLLGTIVMAAIMGRAVQEDFEYRTQNFFFTSPISKLDYLLGRFLGALGVTLVVFVSIPLAAWIATALPGMDVERLGPNRLMAYVVPYLLILLPNAILIGGVFFNVAAMTRKMLPVYIGSVLILIGWLLSTQLLRDLDNKTIAALVDPFGSRAISILTEYWTVSERNTLMIPLDGVFLWNRLLWLGFALAITALCVWRFSFAQFSQERVSKKRAAALTAEAADSGSGKTASTATLGVRAIPDPSRAWRMVPGLVGLYFKETVKNIYFAVIVVAGLLFMIFASTTLGGIFGTNTWPLTFQIMELVSGTFAFFMLVIIAFYGGELVWRERDFRLDQIVDATPMPTWVPMISKLLALMLVPTLLQAVLMLCGMGIQLVHGYTHLEPGLYFQDLFGIRLLDYWLLCALAITIHSVVNQKYLGHFVMVAYYVFLWVSTSLGLEHHLYKFDVYPEGTYSDMNGYGHFLFRVRVFQAYWTSCSVLMLLGAYVMWTRGTISGWRERMAVARTRVTVPVVALAVVALVSFVGLGGFIFYNTNILNAYLPEGKRQALQAEYEKTYKSLAAVPQLKITGVQVHAALYPSEQRVRLTGHYDLENKNSVPVSNVDLSLVDSLNEIVHKLDLGVPNTLTENNVQMGVRRYQLTQPLAPGATTTLTFDLERPTVGFTNNGSNTSVVYNGSFLNGRAELPMVGYQRGGELETDQDRRKYGLAPRDRVPDRDDPAGLQRNGLSSDADWIHFEAEVSTEADQIAIAPGYLQKEWTQDGRRHFLYRMDVPILNFFAFQSARYAEKRDVWHDPVSKRDVRLEVYYQPGHEFNIDRMLDASKAALEYNSTRFGDYQYDQFRILEFPRYESFAQSFPNTVPFSEGIGFIARVRPDDPKDIDYPYYVTAHEAAHQWWGHQVAAADVQGGTMLIETMAQYSALMVMKHKYGEGKMRRFLSYELNRYLIDRSLEQKKELPLARVENQQYIHYRKGSVVMYALQDYIGEDKLNEAIKAFRDETAFKGPPYPNTTQLLKHIRAVTPPDMQYLIDDMFENIVLYENRAVSATAKPLADGKYEVTLKVQARKVRADELGKEQPVPINDFIDIGVVDEKGDAVELHRERINKEDNTFVFTVDKKPVKAGIDPLNKLIDRVPRDNVIAVEVAS